MCGIWLGVLMAHNPAEGMDLCAIGLLIAGIVGLFVIPRESSTVYSRARPMRRPNGVRVWSDSGRKKIVATNEHTMPTPSTQASPMAPPTGPLSASARRGRPAGSAGRRDGSHRARRWCG